MTLSDMRKAFLSPGAAYSPLPFWFWNDRLTKEELTRQIDDFRAHGVMGFVIHPRKGLDRSIGYMTEAYLALVRHAVDEAAARGMQVMLYDEGMYPSGSAHGMVVEENRQWAARCLQMAATESPLPHQDDFIAVCAVSLRDGTFADPAVIAPGADGMYRVPAGKERLLFFWEDFSRGTIRGLFPGEDDGELLAPRAADLLNAEATAAFIRLTHEKYYAAMPEHFGRTITAFFTDEPDLLGRNHLPGAMPWTTGFLAEFGDPADLPHLWFDIDGRTQAVRRRYHSAIRARLRRTFYQPLSDWCAAHGIALTGHPAKGQDIGLLGPFQIPGQDLVWRQVYPGNGLEGAESVAARAAADSARHAGKRRVACEYLGVCGPLSSPWAMTPGDLKWYTDFLLARGVNLLIPHAFYYSIREERRNERPPDVGPNNTWWPFFGDFAAYMARMSWLLTDSTALAQVAVLCGEAEVPWECCAPLYEHQVGFCYLEAALLTDCRVEGGCLTLRQQRYTHLITGGTPLTAAQEQVVGAFRASGGTVLDASEVAARIGELPAPCVCRADPNLRVTHLLREGKHFYLLVNEGDRLVCSDLTVPEAGAAQWWDAWHGTITPAYLNPWGAYGLRLYPRESVILCIDPEEPAPPMPEEYDPWRGGPPFAVFPLLAQRWTLTRPDGASCTLTPHNSGASLPGWETLPGWEDYSGPAVYETEISAPHDGLIDLGEVHEIARVWVNGEYAGCRMWAPYAFRLPVTSGRVKLRVEVTNTPANRLGGVPVPSGLCGAAFPVHAPSPDDPE